jgi:hypothetical protein
MFRFFRRYNRWILVVGGTLLLVAFLVPEAIQGLSRASAGSGATWATVGPDREEVSAGDLDRVRRELQVIAELNDPDAMLLGYLGALRRPEHWYLLTREAEAAGLVGGEGVGRARLGSLNAVFLQQGLPARTENEMVGALAAQTQQTPDFVLQTIAKLDGVLRLINLGGSAARLSDTRLVQTASAMLTEYGLDLVVIPAKADAGVEEPTPAELEAHLKTYSDVLPGQGEQGFGYRRPHRVKIEWLTVPVAVIRESVSSTDAVDGVALAKYWQTHQDAFKPDPAAPTPPFEQVRDRVRDTLVNELTQQKMQQIAKFAGDMLLAPTLPLGRDGIHFQLPADWDTRRASFPAVAEAVANEFNVALPAYQSSGDNWMTESELQTLPGIGRASSTKFGTAPVMFSRLVMAAKELDNSPTIPVQKGVPSPPLSSGDGSLYFFQILDAEASHPPASIDEVRDQLAADVKRLKHFERLQQQLAELEAQARRDGLVAVAQAHGSTVETVTRLTESTWIEFRDQRIPIPSSLGSLGEVNDTIETITRRGAELPRTVPVAEIPEGERIFAVPVEQKLALAIVRITAMNPVTRERYELEAMRGTVRGMVQQESVNPESIMARFGFDALAGRHQFALASAAREGEADEEAEAPADAQAKG